MNSVWTIRNISFDPPLLCAPLAGITHSAFRRLVSDFGGCGALFTEMLDAKKILKEDSASPYLKRRPQEQRLIYQLMIANTDRIEEIIDRLAPLKPDGIDINLACHAPVIRNRKAGSQLFQDAATLIDVLAAVRRCWPGLLTVKIRLGKEQPGWQERFAERARIFGDNGVDAIILHPRFHEDKFKRRARYELLDWAASLTHLPFIVSGDITGPESLAKYREHFSKMSGFMLGRIVAVRPWIFAAWQNAIPIDYGEVWRRLFYYIYEDFEPDQALVRIKLFTRYYSRNFHFGHDFCTSIHNSPTLDRARERGELFFSRNPAVLNEPSLLGI